MTTTATFRSGFGRAAAAAVTAACVTAALLARPAIAASGGAPTVLVLPASGRDVSAAIIDRTRALLVQSLGRPDRFHVIDYDRPATALPADPAGAVALARMHDADVAVSLDVSHQAGQTTFDLVCHDAITGRAACHLRETTRAGPELLPDFAEWLALRLARALRGDAAATPLAPATPARPRALTFGVRAALLAPFETPSTDQVVMGGLGVLMAADAGYLLADVGADYASANGQHLGSVGFGVYAPFTGRASAPYLGACVRWVDQRFGGRGATGLQLRPTVGMVWGRHEVVRLRLEAGYFIDTFDEQKVDRLIPGSDARYAARGLDFTMGVTF